MEEALENKGKRNLEEEVKFIQIKPDNGSAEQLIVLGHGWFYFEECDDNRLYVDNVVNMNGQPELIYEEIEKVAQKRDMSFVEIRVDTNKHETRLLLEKRGYEVIEALPGRLNYRKSI